MQEKYKFGLFTLQYSPSAYLLANKDGFRTEVRILEPYDNGYREYLHILCFIVRPEKETWHPTFELVDVLSYDDKDDILPGFYGEIYNSDILSGNHSKERTERFLKKNSEYLVPLMDYLYKYFDEDFQKCKEQGTLDIKETYQCSKCKKEYTAHRSEEGNCPHCYPTLYCEETGEIFYGRVHYPEAYSFFDIFFLDKCFGYHFRPATEDEKKQLEESGETIVKKQ